MNQTTASPSWTAAAFARPPRQHAVRPMISMADLDPDGGLPWSGAQRFAALGFAGAVMAIPDWYHDPEHKAEIFQRLRATLDEAEAADLPLFIRDDFAYPSATAGGEVIRRNWEHRAKGLFFVLGTGGHMHHINGGSDFFADLPEGRIHRIFLLPLSSDKTYDLSAAVEASFTVWSHACCRIAMPEGKWHLAALVEREQYDGTYGERLNHGMRRLANLLDPRAMESYLECMHQHILAEAGDHFGRGLAGFFSEEIETAGVPAAAQAYPSVPWHDGLADVCTESGFDVYRALLAVFLDDTTPAGLSLRQRFWKAFANRIDACCFQRLRHFCDDHGVAWTGHLIAHDGPSFQIPFHGPLTAVLRRMHLPGVDFIAKGKGVLTSRQGGRGPGAKLVASTAWLSRCNDSIAEANAIEPGWRGQRAVFTYHLALGITVMNSFHWRTWSEDADMARKLNSYAARLALFLKSGDPVRSSALLCPFGHLMAFLRIAPEPFLGTQPDRLLGSQDAYHACAWELLERQCDYAVVDEPFIQQGCVKDGALHIGPGRFHALFLPPTAVLETATWQRLTEFAAAGGRIVMQGNAPTWVLQADGAMLETDSLPCIDTVHCASEQEWLLQCVRKAGPLIECAEPAPNLYVQARMSEEGVRRYLLANLEWERKEYRLKAVPGTRVIVYDPWDATVIEGCADADGIVALEIDGGAAVIIEYGDDPSLAHGAEKGRCEPGELPRLDCFHFVDTEHRRRS